MSDLRDSLVVSGTDASQYSPLALAYLGDSVYEIYIRTRLVGRANMQVNKLNKQGSSLAMAVTQAAMVDALEDYFTDEERVMLQRGKNAKVGGIPKSATAREYHKATGFETMLGYLYLKKEDARIEDIILTGWKRLEVDNE